jgi:D-alanyl-D-alanine carboxypeptidase
MAVDRRSLDRAADYLRSWLAYRYEYSNLTGYVAAISWKGDMVLNEACGLADVGRGTVLEPGHIFRVASHSKTFTATALMQLAEEGRLRLDDPVANFLPWLSAHRDHRFRQVSLHQLATHGSGVTRDGRDCDFWQLEQPFPDADQLRDEVLSSALVTEPNLALKYSNIGYSLLGMVVEEASGQAYADYVNDHIVKPLGLSSTGPEWQGRGPEAVTGHTRRDAKGERRGIPVVNTAAMAPATGFYSTAEELCRYFTAHMCGSGRLISDASKREMQRVQWHVHKPAPDVHEDYGLGLHLEEVEGRATFGHGGGFPGQITRSVADPASGLVVVVLTNCADGPASEMARGIFGVLDFFDRHREPARARWKGLEGRYANLWSVRDLVGAGSRLLVTSPDTWRPLKECDELEPVRGDTWRIADTSSFGSAGELVTFRREDGVVKQARFGGMSAWPEPQWAEEEKRLVPTRRTARKARSTP